jgi:hypothetical protein
MPRAILAVLLLLPALAGCGGTWASGPASGSSDELASRAAVRAAIPALEAYYADNGTYAGASADALRQRYDSAITNVRIVRAGATTYCVQSTVGAATTSKHGPAAELTSGSC